MKLCTLLLSTIVAAALTAVKGASIDYDKVRPFAQPKADHRVREGRRQVKAEPPRTLPSMPRVTRAEDLSGSNRSGEVQDLIMWEQLTDDARSALNETDFGEFGKVPFIDASFNEQLEAAQPIHKSADQ